MGLTKKANSGESSWEKQDAKRESVDKKIRRRAKFKRVKSSRFNLVIVKKLVTRFLGVNITIYLCTK